MHWRTAAIARAWRCTYFTVLLKMQVEFFNKQAKADMSWTSWWLYTILSHVLTLKHWLFLKSVAYLTKIWTQVWWHTGVYVFWPSPFLFHRVYAPSLPIPSPSRGPISLIQLRCLGERCKLPSGSGQSPAAKWFMMHFELKRSLLVVTSC